MRIYARYGAIRERVDSGTRGLASQVAQGRAPPTVEASQVDPRIGGCGASTVVVVTFHVPGTYDDIAPPGF